MIKTDECNLVGIFIVQTKKTKKGQITKIIHVEVNFSTVVEEGILNNIHEFFSRHIDTELGILAEY